MKISNKWIRLCNIACAVLLIALLLCQLMPFWKMPGCTCTGACTSQQEVPECEACSIYFKWCENLPQEYQAGNVGDNGLDTSEDWYVSIQQYTWIPTFESCRGVTEYFSHLYNTPDYKFMVKDIVLMPIICVFFCAFGAFFGITMSKNPIISFFSLGAGVAAVCAYLTMPIYQLGMLWQVHLVIAVMLTLIALIPLTECIFRAIKWLNPKG